jgi:tryptophanyl-tRNA synthetase
MEQKINPYSVEGKIDYDRIIEEFGIKELSDEDIERFERITGEKAHPFLRRGIFFAHRDLNWVLDEYEKGNKFFLYTGCGPSGPIHIGHLGTWLFTKWLQDVFDVELWFQFTDDEKFLFKDKSYEEIQEWTRENMIDVAALGFDPKKTHFIIDTVHAGLMYPEAIKVAKKITFSTIKGAFGFTDSNNIGSIFYTAMQTVPAFLPNVINNDNKPCLIPLGVDQDPHFRVGRDVIEKLGYHKPAIIHAKMMPPLTGVLGKMSSSDSNKAILTTDNPQTVKKKINKYAFSGGQDSVEKHRELGGNPDIDVSFQWLKYFEPSDEKLREIEEKYRSGELLSGELKAMLIEKINTFLAVHQQQREMVKDRIDDFIYHKK